MVDLITYRYCIGRFYSVSARSNHSTYRHATTAPRKFRQSKTCIIPLMFVCVVIAASQLCILCLDKHLPLQNPYHPGRLEPHIYYPNVQSPCLYYPDVQLSTGGSTQYFTGVIVNVLVYFVVNRRMYFPGIYCGHQIFCNAISYSTKSTEASCTGLGTCPYLLGNVGMHSYNGNPPMFRSGNLVPDIKERIKELHYKMVNELSGYLDPSMDREWQLLINLLNTHLKPVDIKKSKSLMDVCEKLLTKGKIQYGQYQTLRDMFSDIEHQICCGIVDKYSQQIEESRQLPTELQTPQPARETQTPQSATETQTLHPTAETQTPQSATETQTLHPTAETQTLQPARETQTPQPTRETQRPRPTREIQTPQPTRETQTLQPARETQTPQLAKGTKRPRPTRETQGPHPAKGTKRPRPNRETHPPQPTRKMPTQKGDDMRTLHEETDALAECASGFGAGETVYSRDTAASSYKMPSGEETRRLHEVVDALARHAYATGFGAAETVYSRDTAASSHNKMPSVDMEASVKVWRSNDKLCYETKGIKDVVQKICSDEHSYICVVGEPGCGKSTAIRHAALYLQDKLGFIIYPVSGPKQFVDYLDPDKTQVFIYDDFCGEYFIDQDKLKAWGEYSEKTKDCLQVHKNTKVLFSLRVQLYSELKSKGNTHIYNDQRHVINFSDKEYKLSRDTMQDMLRHYLQVHHIQNIEGLIRRVWWGRAEQFAGCFPLLCKVFSEDKSVRVDPRKYFSDPWPALQNIFERIKSDNKHQFCGLLLCGITDLKDEYFSTSYKQNKPQQFDSLIESQNLDPRKDLSYIKSALQALDGVYISHIGNRYTFLHSIFQNIVTFLYDDKYYVFKYATLDFIETRVRLFSKFDTDDDYVKVFYGDDCVELLVDRMIEELLSDDRYRWWGGVRFIVDSHYIDNKELITCLMEKLFDSKHTQITQDKIDRLFVVCLDTVCNYTPSPPHTDVTSCPQYQLLLSLIARCGCNKQIEGWQYPLLVSVVYGSLPVTKALVEHQADVNVVDSVDKQCVLHLAVYCDNNVDMTKYLLSLPNLKCLNHRDSDGHTPYWYVVNNTSPWYWSDVDVQHRDVQHRDELMKLYKHTAAICE